MALYRLNGPLPIEWPFTDWMALYRLNDPLPIEWPFTYSLVHALLVASYPVSLVESLAPADRGHAHFTTWS